MEVSNPKTLKREILRKSLHCTNCNALAVGHLTQDINEMKWRKIGPAHSTCKNILFFLNRLQTESGKLLQQAAKKCIYFEKWIWYIFRPTLFWRYLFCRQVYCRSSYLKQTDHIIQQLYLESPLNKAKGTNPEAFLRNQNETNEI